MTRAVLARHPLKHGRAPAWAVSWGEDQYGAFAAFAVGSPGLQVEQQMRWIRPGTFLMGSPLDELGRYDDEGPQHPVTITKGYWLGATPVTQALWLTVMGENPSQFAAKQAEELQRPVELVSWDDCQEFVGRLNAQVPGLAARLPTEAEWERACRGGTQGATWAGALSGEAEAPELDAIAWYSGNSNGSTHPVGRKAPNSNGLQDMLGNVYEWCQDAARGMRELYPYPAEPVVDPVQYSHDRGSCRVFRGGSWHSRARSVRAAARFAVPPDDRVVSIGLRLAGG